MDKSTSIAKKVAGFAAADLITDGMLVGLGTGSTVAHFLERLAERCRSGLRILAVATSNQTLQLAINKQIPLADINHLERLDITVDGADEITREKHMIKGGGGALLRERIVAAMSDEMVVIVDERKVVDTLGKFPLPLEIVPFAWQATMAKLLHLGFHGKLRRSYANRPYITDNENFIIDLQFDQPIIHPRETEKILLSVPGVLKTGLFLDIAGRVIIGKENGTVEIRT